PAVSAAQCTDAMRCRAELVAGLDGKIVGSGVMGIGNTTAAAATTQEMTQLPAPEGVGVGTGLCADGMLDEAQVVQAAVPLHAAVVSTQASLDILATFGGFEIAMIVGAMLAAAERRMVLLIDGFIVTSALLIAARLQPAILDYCVFAHCSDEHGHSQML